MDSKIDYNSLLSLLLACSFIFDDHIGIIFSPITIHLRNSPSELYSLASIDLSISIDFSLDDLLLKDPGFPSTGRATGKPKAIILDNPLS
ncbi:hypothetical protein MJO29_015301 [Puccinia striiformis f. sp. tritici]|nr:hypothetical protein MJO29_015301 [Puccinia striiformis f. sp. tritici]